MPWVSIREQSKKIPYGVSESLFYINLMIHCSKNGVASCKIVTIKFQNIALPYSLLKASKHALLRPFSFFLTIFCFSQAASSLASYTYTESQCRIFPISLMSSWFSFAYFNIGSVQLKKSRENQFASSIGFLSFQRLLMRSLSASTLAFLC